VDKEEKIDNEELDDNVSIPSQEDIDDVGNEVNKE